MKMLKSIHDVNALMNAVASCQDPVILKSADGSEEYNLKSALSELIGIAQLCQEDGDTYEIFCVNHADEGFLINFFRNLSKNDGTAA